MLEKLKNLLRWKKEEPYVDEFKEERGWWKIAQVVAKKSIDKSRKVGCILRKDFGNGEEVFCQSFNRMPWRTNHLESRYERPIKYYTVEHAERLAIYKAAELGISTKGATMYVTCFPCADCARAIIQAGIEKLVCEEPDYNHPRWSESFYWANQMLKEAGVEVITFAQSKNDPELQ